jgi:hypothetical protein
MTALPVTPVKNTASPSAITPDVTEVTVSVVVAVFAVNTADASAPINE